MKDDGIFILIFNIGGNLLSYVMDTADPWPEDQCQFYGAEILLALEHIHSKNIVYKYVWICGECFGDCC